MHITIIAVGTRMPAWVTCAYNEFIKRLPHYVKVKFIEIPVTKRTKNYNSATMLAAEEKQILDKLPKNNPIIIALEVLGKSLSTEDLARHFQLYQNSGDDLVFLIGGPDGLAKNCSNLATLQLSLSKLTFPHALVRVILAEQIYRAFSILENHPYHRV